MTLWGTLIWICSLAVWFAAAAQDETKPPSMTHVFGNEDCKEIANLVMAKCNSCQRWLSNDTAALLLTLRNLTENAHKQQLKDCHGAEPRQCPEPKVPENGGLACVTVDNKRYCKPLCNNLYDFAFLRRSRPFEECSLQTRYKWETQYIGGTTLAVCNKVAFPVSGTDTMYFPQDCLTTKSDSELQKRVFEELYLELKKKGIGGVALNACLTCG